MHLGIDFGTSYTKLGYFRDNIFINLAGEDQVIPTVVTYASSVDKLYFGSLALRLTGPAYLTSRFFKLELKRNPNFSLGPCSLNRILLEFFCFLQQEYLEPYHLIPDSIAVSVPNYFGLNSRRILKEAVQEAFQVEEITLVPEPVAALLGCNMGHGDFKLQGDLLCIDIGGGTTDFSFLSFYGETDLIMEAQFQMGSDTFSGCEMDRGLIRNILLPAYKMQTGTVFPENFLAEKKLNHQDQLIFNRILNLAEKTKIEISQEDYCHLHQPDFWAGKSLVLSITSDMFKYYLQPIYERLKTYINKSVKPRARSLGLYDQSEWCLDYVLLLGGASQTTGVRKLIQQCFGQVAVITPPDLNFNVVKGLGAWDKISGSSSIKVKIIYPFGFYIEKQDKSGANSIVRIPFDTSNLELDLKGRYQIFSLPIKSDFNLSGEPGRVNIRVYEVEEQAAPTTAERFIGQELIFQLDTSNGTLPDTLNLYLDLNKLAVDADSRSDTSLDAIEDIFNPLITQPEEIVDWMSNYEFSHPQLLNDFRLHLKNSEPEANCPYHGQARTTLFKLLSLLQFLK